MLLLACLHGTGAIAGPSSSAQTWLSAGVQTPLSQSVFLDATVLQKSNPTLTELYQVYPMLVVGFAPQQSLRLLAGLRYAFVWKEGREDQQLRLFQDLKLRSSTLFSIRVRYRFRFQQTHSENTGEWTPVIRNRFAVDAPLSPYFEPGLFAEHFLDLSESFGRMSSDYRLGLRIGCRISRAHRLRLEFFRNTDLITSGTTDILALDYHHHF